VPLRRPKFIFDVHIPSYVQSGKITQPEWRSVLKFLSSRARYAVSSITLYELIAGIDGGDDAHFPDNQDQLKILCEPAGREFLPLASDFVRSVVFKLPIRARAFESDKLKRWVDVILKAPSKADLLAGNVVVRGQTYGSDLASRVDEIRQGKKQDAKRLEKLQRNQPRVWTPELLLTACEGWHTTALKRMDVQPTPENVAEVKDRLDAAWFYERERYKLSRNKTYNFTENASDWLDSQLLFYLADPQIHLVAFDAKIQKRVKGSKQASRVLLFSELQALASIP
jgi:hypothetical protein